MSNKEFFTDEKIKEILNREPDSFAAMCYWLGRKEALLENLDKETLDFIINRENILKNA
jgi:phosphoserine phosphatase